MFALNVRRTCPKSYASFVGACWSVCACVCVSVIVAMCACAANVRHTCRVKFIEHALLVNAPKMSFIQFFIDQERERQKKFPDKAALMCSFCSDRISCANIKRTDGNVNDIVRPTAIHKTPRIKFVYLKRFFLFKFASPFSCFGYSMK